jgi:hypothetical protein
MSIIAAVLWTAAIYALWTLGLMWPEMPPSTAGTVILVASGVVFGVLMHRWFGPRFLEIFGPDGEFHKRFPKARA